MIDIFFFYRILGLTARVQVVKRTGRIDGIRLIELPRGVINEDVIWAYRNGQCVALARAISELTGWPIVFIFYNPMGERPQEWASYWDGRTVAKWRSDYEQKTGSSLSWARGAFGRFVHAYVRTSSGELLDIGGAFSVEDVKKAYEPFFGPVALLEATIEDIESLLTEGMHPRIQPRPDVRLAREYARLVLKQAGYR